jgi:histidinol dehydrogenase
VLTRLDLRGFTGDLVATLAPSRDEDDAPVTSVREIIAAVRARGDEALRELTQKFDGCDLDDPRVPETEITSALARVAPEFREALEYAAGEIRAYHEAQLTPGVSLDRDGVSLRERVVPVARAGCYIPGGRATYPSTVLMTAIPAQVAGVGQVVLTIPPAADGRLPDATLAAASLLGVGEIYRVGGAQAIAALAYGTKTIAPVDVIVGPGNAYVTAAKREVTGVVGIESLAGPSELVVVADGDANPELVAADLLAQAEHGPDGAAVLVTWSDRIADAVDAAVVTQTAAAPRRSEIEATIASAGRSVLVEGPDQAIAAVNVIAPEHLELMTADPESLVPLVRNAGAVFCGRWAPAAVGDYVAGVNHVLPTSRTARFASALRVDDFRKHLHVVRATPTGSAALSRVAAVIARAEGLDEHAHSLDLRAQL